MKYKITMLCNEKQFKAIKPKLEGKVEFSMLSEFNNRQKFYLINHLGKNLMVTNVTSPREEKEVTRYEKWNEQIFLEACGIEKEKTFTITESQINTLNEIFETTEAYQGQDYLKEWFQEVFEIEVKSLPKDFTGWCKCSDIKNELWLGYFKEGSLQYGFDGSGRWFNEAYPCKISETEREATESEVFESLKNEAVKRGYTANNFVKDIIMSGEVQIQGSHYEMHKKYGFMMGDSTVFKDGVWAELLETISINDAEKMLGKKIIQ